MPGKNFSILTLHESVHLHHQILYLLRLKDMGVNRLLERLLDWLMKRLLKWLRKRLLEWLRKRLLNRLLRLRWEGPRVSNVYIIGWLMLIAINHWSFRFLFFFFRFLLLLFCSFFKIFLFKMFSPFFFHLSYWVHCLVLASFKILFRFISW